MTAIANPASIPLCVDCDGTLLRTDLLHESVFALAKQSPASLLWLPLWLSRGKAYMKQQIAARVKLDYDSLPICEEMVDRIKAARVEGRRIVLATASPRPWAEGVAQRIGLFDEVIASDEQVNLAGINKADHLSERFGERQFDYAGNSRADLPVWKRSAGAIVVSSSASLSRAAAMHGPVHAVISPPRATKLTYVKSLRAHQWLKNLLVWVPLAAAHKLGSTDGLLNGLIAFFSFSFCASAVYVLNDLLDLEADRLHIRKRKRPFASGALPIWQGALMIPALLLASFLLAILLPLEFLAVLVAYFAMTVAYSVRLKRQVIVDVLLLATLYTVRVVAGAAATEVLPSFWLLAMSMFIFLSLAMVKRYSELLITLQLNKQSAVGRGYSVQDLPVLMAIGVSAGMSAVMVLALYVNAPEAQALYNHTTWLWLLPPVLLYWVSRIWMKAHRGEVDDDPVVFAVRDWQSLVIGAILASLLWLAA
jgi:4-hydroxybenzoate polyprenyltransferase/phosphoserine phosphatase